MSLDARFAPNPDYGSGIYRRRVTLEARPGLIEARLVDDYHDMSVAIEHDGADVTHPGGTVVRAPFTTCPSAPAALSELIGLPLSVPRKLLYSAERPQRNCTHLFDLAAFALSLAATRRTRRVMDFVVPDLVDEGSLVEACLDDVVVHSWRISSNEAIIEPSCFAGRSLFGGFASWANNHFNGIELELALHLQKAVLVARGRRFLVASPGTTSIRDEPERLGACFTFSEPRFSNALSNPDYVRDFSHRPPTTEPLI